MGRERNIRGPVAPVDYQRSESFKCTVRHTLEVKNNNVVGLMI